MRFVTLLTIICAILCLGCPSAGDPSLPEPPTSEGSTIEPIEVLVDRTLEQNLRDRTLSSLTHGAWQILHGVLAYGDRFLIETPEGEQAAIPYLLQGKTVQGFEPIRGDRLGNPERPGLRMAMQPSTKVGQGHRDQWLAVLSQSGLSLDTELKTETHTFTMEDWMRQVEYDVPRNLELEFSWTLIALTQYRETNHQWIGRDRVTYSTEQLLASELQQSIPASVCGGTHRLIGIAMSLAKRRSEDRPVTGVWAQAEAQLTDFIDVARRNQNPDGSYGVDYLHRPGWARDLGESLGTTGHVLEFLALAAPDRVLTEPWVERTARRLCGILAECEGIDLECGVLYHALHGLQEYRARLATIAQRDGE
ncbi:MAG: ADP-ribosylation factor-directed GTPase activating protein isoform b [Planctomycetota bacterium]